MDDFDIDLVEFEKKYTEYIIIDIIKKENLKFFSFFIDYIEKIYINLSICLITPVFKLLQSDVLNSEKYKNIWDEVQDRVYAGVRHLICDSDMYKKLEEDYYNYLNKLVSFFIKQKITDSIDVAIFYQLLLSNGFLSYNKKFKYDNDLTKEYAIKNNKYELEYLLGARISTGEAVCRHQTSLYIDIQNNIGNFTWELNVLPIYKKDLYNFLKLNSVETNHLIAITQNEKYIFSYDATNNLFLDIINANKSINEYKNLILKPNIKLKKEDEDILYIAPSDKNNYDIDSKLSINLLDKSELNERCNMINRQFNEEKDKDILNFYLETRNQLERINKQINEISPIKKEKIKRLIIK